ncbi:Protocadherin-like wing polarity protein stan, partial [Fragariocoptes setiger]
MFDLNKFQRCIATSRPFNEDDDDKALTTAPKTTANDEATPYQITVIDYCNCNSRCQVQHQCIMPPIYINENKYVLDRRRNNSLRSVLVTNQVFIALLLLLSSTIRLVWTAAHDPHAPQFSERQYTAKVLEDIAWKSRPIVARVTATDADEGAEAHLRYSIIGDSVNSQSTFQIDPVSGHISVVAPLDYEIENSYRLVVRAQDSGSPVRSNVTFVTITVVDVNDNTPHFTNPCYQETIVENTPPNTKIMRVQAFDGDSGDNGAVRYDILRSSLMPQQQSSQFPFSIDAETGFIHTTQTIDREENSMYEFIVEASDLGIPSRTSTSTVKILVEDVNDNRPQFDSQIYEAQVTELSPPGTQVITVQATDRDDSSRLTFAIVAGNIRSRFSITTVHNNQGVISVAQPLDYKLERRYSLLVSATDSGGLKDEATIMINVTDANTHRPVIERGPYSVQVPEDVPVGHTVVTIIASDADVDDNARLTYTLDASGDSANVYSVISVEGSSADRAMGHQNGEFAANDFRIDSNTGAIHTTRRLDRERVAGYTLVVSVRDNGIPSFSDTTNVEIEVTDVNDCAPKFVASTYISGSGGGSAVFDGQPDGLSGLASLYKAWVSEDAPVGTTVLKLHATDADVGANSQIRYSLQGGDSEATFSIDPMSGVLRTNRTLDRELVPSYDLIVLAIDRGMPALTSSASVHISVTDVNDNAPHFPSTTNQASPGFNSYGLVSASEKLTFFVPENVAIGSKVAELRAYDPDEGDNARIEYSIVGGADAKGFNLYQRDGTDFAELISHVELDYESPKTRYHLVVRATSGGGVSAQKSEIDVEILVTDENDNPPKLDDFTIVFNNYRGHFPITPIGRVPASDADASDQLRYKILSGNNANWLSLNETTGEIMLSPALNSNVPMRALFEIVVTDGINEVKAQCLLIVSLITDTMLSNAVMLRLEHISREEFLSDKYDAFVKAMAHILGSSSAVDDIVVFDVQSSSSSIVSATPTFAPAMIDSNSNTNINADTGKANKINVTFAVRAPDQQRDTESYLSAQFVRERVYLNRALLAQLISIQVSPTFDNSDSTSNDNYDDNVESSNNSADDDDDVCVHEPCLNYQQCITSARFLNASRGPFLATRHMLFRPVTPTQAYTCLCPATFAGLAHKFECDVDVNSCHSSPCLNGATCRSHELGHTCQCAPGFVGPRCEHSFVNSSCSPAANALCAGGSKCQSIVSPLIASQQLAGQVSATSTTSTSASYLSQLTRQVGFRCVGCPAPLWSNELCQLRARSFARGSYVSLRAIRQRHRFHLSLRFATRSPDGLLIYNGRYDDRRDFIALEIVNGHLQFQFSTGDPHQVAQVQLTTTGDVADGEWHTVSVEYRDRSVTLALDNCDPVLDRALEAASITSSQQHQHSRCSNSTQFQLEARCANKLERCYRFLDLTAPMQLGALPSPTTATVTNVANRSPIVASLLSRPFVGCISDLTIDHELVDLNDVVVNNNTQIGCSEKRSFCHSQPCANGATCRDAWGTYACSCLDGFTSVDCSQRLSSASQTVTTISASDQIMNSSMTHNTMSNQSPMIKQFTGNSYVLLARTLSPPILATPWRVALSFRTVQANGVVARIVLEQPDSIIGVDLHDGYVQFMLNSARFTLPRARVNDGAWHTFEAYLPTTTSAILRLDYGRTAELFVEDLGGDIRGMQVARVTLGASISASTITPVASIDLTLNTTQSTSAVASNPSFVGCIQALEITGFCSTLGDSPTLASTTNTGSSTLNSFIASVFTPPGIQSVQEPLWLELVREERNVDTGVACHLPPPASSCISNAQCPANATCRKGRCTCRIGHVGAACVPACSLMPCASSQARCVSGRQSAGSQIPHHSADTVSDDDMLLNSDVPISIASSETLAIAQLLDAPMVMYSMRSAFQCECDAQHTGKYCQLAVAKRCPSNWWSSVASTASTSALSASGGSNNAALMCAPCNCNESHGFDADCDKHTGACSCKLNHYRPTANSDHCLPCDCYSIGSLGASCSSSMNDTTNNANDITVGQCKCRTGVVGRRCDTCTSPLAEVTHNGCQVIYDACPRSLAASIWWPRTPFGASTSVQCAHGAQGNATRTCDARSGQWLEPETFSCISNLFIDLAADLSLLENSSGANFPMTSELSIKLAAALADAIEQQSVKHSIGKTVSHNLKFKPSSSADHLTGSDVLIALRILHHVLRFESKQRGLALAHKQDRKFIRNTVESVSAILGASPETWARVAQARSTFSQHQSPLTNGNTVEPTIATTKAKENSRADNSNEQLPLGGAEHVLRLLDAYARTIIDQQLDTFTQPFEVATDNLIFGLDLVATNQLFDLSRPSFVHAPGNTPVTGDSPSHTVARTTTMTTLPTSGEAAVVVPKYDSYAPDRRYVTQAVGLTRAFIPLKLLKVKAPRELLPDSFYRTSSSSNSLMTASISNNLINNDFASTFNSILAADKPSDSVRVSRVVRNANTIATPTTTASIAEATAAALQSSPSSLKEALTVHHQPTAVVVYAIYRTLGALLPANFDTSVQHRLGTWARPNTPVVWLNWAPANVTVGTSSNHSAFVQSASNVVHPNSRITYSLRTLEASARARPQCVAWNFVDATSTSSINGAADGQFTARSCDLVGVAYDHVNCSCDATLGSAVVVLMDDTPNGLDDELDGSSIAGNTLVGGASLSSYAQSSYLSMGSQLSGVSSHSSGRSMRHMLVYITLCLSCVVLALVLIVLLIHSKTKRYVHTNICKRHNSHLATGNALNITRHVLLCLVVLDALLLFSLRPFYVTQAPATMSFASRMYSNPANQQQQQQPSSNAEYQCKMIAIFLHYFSVSAFAWLSVGALHAYRMLTEIRDINRGPMRFYALLGYALPAVLVTLAVGVRAEQFGNHLFCWLSVREPIVWSMLMPVGGAFVLGICLIVLAARRAMSLLSKRATSRLDSATGFDRPASSSFMSFLLSSQQRHSAAGSGVNAHEQPLAMSQRTPSGDLTQLAHSVRWAFMVMPLILVYWLASLHWVNTMGAFTLSQSLLFCFLLLLKSIIISISCVSVCQIRSLLALVLSSFNNNSNAATSPLFATLTHSFRQKENENTADNVHHHAMHARGYQPGPVSATEAGYAAALGGVLSVPKLPQLKQQQQNVQSAFASSCTDIFNAALEVASVSTRSTTSQSSASSTTSDSASSLTGSASASTSASAATGGTHDNRNSSRHRHDSPSAHRRHRTHRHRRHHSRGHSHSRHHRGHRSGHDPERRHHHRHHRHHHHRSKASLGISSEFQEQHSGHRHHRDVSERHRRHQQHAAPKLINAELASSHSSDVDDDNQKYVPSQTQFSPKVEHHQEDLFKPFDTSVDGPTTFDQALHRLSTGISASGTAIPTPVQSTTAAAVSISEPKKKRSESIEQHEASETEQFDYYKSLAAIQAAIEAARAPPITTNAQQNQPSGHSQATTHSVVDASLTQTPASNVAHSVAHANAPHSTASTSSSQLVPDSKFEPGKQKQQQLDTTRPKSPRQQAMTDTTILEEDEEGQADELTV